MILQSVVYVTPGIQTPEKNLIPNNNEFEFEIMPQLVLDTIVSERVVSKEAKVAGKFTFFYNCIMYVIIDELLSGSGFGGRR